MLSPYLSVLITITTITQPVKVSLGDTIDPYQFHLPIEVVLSSTQHVDTMVLGTTNLDIVHEASVVSFSIQVTNQDAVLRPLIGISSFISQWSLNTDDRFLDLFNPTMQTVPLSLYGLQINQTVIYFASGMTITPMTAKRIRIIDGTQTSSIIDPSLTITLEPYLFMTSLALINLDDANLVDYIPIDDAIATRYGPLPIQNWRFIRYNKTTGPESTYHPNSWVARPHGTIETAHELMSPVVTPLEQATAWATYVMYGAGMFASGRVEEAFEALRSEYEFMDVMSQHLLFSQPSTTMRGINEQGKISQSTFREAIGRYNYLAARVPGATGLSMPSADTFPWLSVLYASLLVMGFVGVIVVLKTRKKRI